MDKNSRKKIEKVYSFMDKIYPANWQTRWGKTPYMKSFAQQTDVNRFIKTKGKFESVPGHVWACIGFWMQLKGACPSLDKLVDSQEVYERLWAHDIGETHRGDISYAVKIHTNLEEGKSEERRDFIKLTGGLPSRIRARLLKWHDEFEKEDGSSLPLEAQVARWIDNLEGDHFALSFGNNLKENSETIGKIFKKRSLKRADSIVSYLSQKSKRAGKNKDLYSKAATEVRKVMQFHTRLIKRKGIKIDLSGFDF